jgi:hypothetical protein
MIVLEEPLMCLGCFLGKSASEGTWDSALPLAFLMLLYPFPGNVLPHLAQKTSITELFMPQKGHFTYFGMP